MLIAETNFLYFCVVLKKTIDGINEWFAVIFLFVLFPLHVSYLSFAKIYRRKIFKMSSFAKISPRENKFTSGRLRYRTYDYHYEPRGRRRYFNLVLTYGIIIVFEFSCITTKTEGGEGYYPCQLALLKLKIKMFIQINQTVINNF